MAPIFAFTLGYILIFIVLATSLAMLFDMDTKKRRTRRGIDREARGSV